MSAAMESEIQRGCLTRLFFLRRGKSCFSPPWLGYIIGSYLQLGNGSATGRPRPPGRLAERESQEMNDMRKTNRGSILRAAMAAVLACGLMMPVSAPAAYADEENAPTPPSLLR